LIFCRSDLSVYVCASLISGFFFSSFFSSGGFGFGTSSTTGLLLGLFCLGGGTFAGISGATVFFLSKTTGFGF